MRGELPFVCVLCVSRSRAGTGCWMNTHVLKLCSALGSNLRAASRQQRGRSHKPRGLAALLVGSREWLGVEESKDRAGEGWQESRSCLTSERPYLALPQAVLQGGCSVCCCL